MSHVTRHVPPPHAIAGSVPDAIGTAAPAACAVAGDTGVAVIGALPSSTQ